MADKTIDELLVDKTKEDYFDELVAAATAEGLSSTAWQEGEPARALMSMVARVLFAFWNVIARPALRGAFLDYSSGGWLTLLAWTMYGVKRKGEEFATASIVVENESASFYSLVPGQIRLKNLDGKTFTSTSGSSIAAYLGSGAKPTATIIFIADEAGTGSDTLAGDLVATPITAPNGIVARTASVAMAGSDAETDAALKLRCKSAMGPLSPAGPLAAYQFVALSTLRPDGTPVAVNRVRVVDTGFCGVEVYLASASGPTPGTMADLTTDVGLVYAALLKQAVPTGFTCEVFGASVATLDLNIELRVDLDSLLTEDEAVAAATAAFNKYITTLPIGGRRSAPLVTSMDDGYLFADELRAKMSESAEGIIRVTTDLGSGDLTVPYNAIAQVFIGDIQAILVKQ